MPNPALPPAIAWKKPIVAANLAYVQRQVPVDAALVQRYQDELDVLKTPDGAAYDLVKANLENHISSTVKSLADYEGKVAHQRVISDDDKEAMAEMRRQIAEMEKLLANLVKGGRP